MHAVQTITSTMAISFNGVFAVVCWNSEEGLDPT